MRNRNRCLRTSHAIKENGWRRRYFHHRETRLELLRLVTREFRPRFCARNNGLEITHHLAAVANAKSKSIGTAEEGRKLFCQLFIEKNSLGPSLTCTQYIAVRETTNSNCTLEICQICTTSNQITHVHINCIKAGFVHHIRCLDL